MYTLKITAICSYRYLSCCCQFRQLSAFPGSLPPSIIDVKELNFCVRHGNRWILLAIVTGYTGFAPSKLNNTTLTNLCFFHSLTFLSISDNTLVCFTSATSPPTSSDIHSASPYGDRLRLTFLLRKNRWSPTCFSCMVAFCSAKRLGQALGLLVPVSSIHYCTSTSGLSTW